MNKIFILILSVFLTSNTIAQLTATDSLQIDSLQLQVSNAKHDTSKINALRNWDELIDRYDKELDLLLIKKIDSITNLNLAKNLKHVEKTFFLNSKGRICYDYGVMETRTREFDKSISYFNQADSVFEITNNYQRRTKALEYIGDIYDYLGQYDTAITIYKRSLEISKANNYDYGISYDLVGIGLLYSRFSDYGRALEYYEKGLELRLKMGDERSIAGAYNNIGTIYYYTGEYGESANYFIKALAIREKLGDDPRGLSNVYGNIGAVLIQQGDYNTSIEYLNKSLEIEKKRDDKQGLAYIYGSLGGGYFRAGEYETSESFYLKSAALYEEIADKKGQATTYNNLATSYFSNKEYEKAQEKAKQAYDIAKELGYKSGIINAISVFGSIQMDKANYPEAINHFYQAFNMSKEINYGKTIRYMLNNLTVCMFATDSLDKAGEYAEELLALRDKDIATQFPVMSEIQKEKYFNTIRSDYDLFFDYALLEGDDQPELNGQAYNYVLMLKGLLLKSSTAMRLTILNSGNDELIGQYYDWISLKRRIATSYARGKDTKTLEEEANQLEKSLVQGSQEFQDIKKVQDLSWQDVQKGLKKGEAAIEFVKFNHAEDFVNEEDRTYLYAALIINHDCKYPKMIRLFEEEKLQKIIGTFPGNNYSYINGLYGSKKQTKTQLYDLIWKPMEKELKDVSKVYLSPDGLLHKIAFSAIAKEQDVYLTDLYKIETKSSTGKITTASDVALNSNISLFGGINYNSDSTNTKIWSYLEGSLTEIEKIEKILKKEKTDYNYYTATTATEAQLKKVAPESNILHIATHGYFYADPDEINEALTEESETEEELVFRGNTKSLGMTAFVNSKNPLMRSGLAFANANDVWNKQDLIGEDGVLTAAEVATLDLRKTELVVLSACETGLGDIKGSEGVYGLQRSFKMAGVNYIIMSLWQVPDKETAEFMSTFYTNLLKYKEVSQAFIITQNSMRKKYDPYFWAAFVLIQ
jgi:CHAT domain-containing protein/Tfp pilus assembly protein PilF